jgi:2-methylcitrate dehydratase
VQSRTPATVMVGGQQTSPDMAAFANGVMTRYLDYNDYCYTHGRGHPSDTVAPVLAAVEAVRGDGKSVILGTVMAYDLLWPVG